MRTHIDTASAVRLVDTDLFAQVRHNRGDLIVQWKPMSPETAFFDENDEVGPRELRRMVPEGRAEIVRVSRVIDVLEVYRCRATAAVG